MSTAESSNTNSLSSRGSDSSKPTPSYPESSQTFYGQPSYTEMEAQQTSQVELFVKAGRDGESYGGCPICQRFFMLLLIKAEFNKHLQLVVTTVNMSKPPSEFKRLATRLPVLSYEDQVCCEPDEMVAYISKQFRYPPMNYDNVEAANACKDVFSKFSFYIKDVSQSPQALLKELSKLDNYLKQCNHIFLNRDLPDHLDCIMLPKLQHLRVACKVFKNFEIPHYFNSLWRYLAAAYNTSAFRESCPSDQEIIFHWESKPECPVLSKEKKLQVLNKGIPYYSFDYPEGILDGEKA